MSNKYQKQQRLESDGDGDLDYITVKLAEANANRKEFEDELSLESDSDYTPEGSFEKVSEEEIVVEMTNEGVKRETPVTYENPPKKDTSKKEKKKKKKRSEIYLTPPRKILMTQKPAYRGPWGFCPEVYAKDSVCRVSEEEQYLDLFLGYQEAVRIKSTITRNPRTLTKKEQAIRSEHKYILFDMITRGGGSSKWIKMMNDLEVIFSGHTSTYTKAIRENPYLRAGFIDGIYVLQEIGQRFSGRDC